MMTFTPPLMRATFSPVGAVSDSMEGPMPSARGKIFTLRKEVRGAGSGSGAGTVCGSAGVGRSCAVWSGASVGGRRVGEVSVGGGVRVWARARELMAAVEIRKRSTGVASGTQELQNAN